MGISVATEANVSVSSMPRQARDLLLWCLSSHACSKDGRSDASDSNTIPSQIAGHGQHESFDSSFRTRVRRLTHLSFSGRDRARENNDTTIFLDRFARVGSRAVFDDMSRHKSSDVERSNEVDIDRFGKHVK